MEATDQTELQVRGLDSIQHVMKAGSQRLVIHCTDGKTFILQPTPRDWYDALRNYSTEPEIASELITAVSTTIPQTERTEALRNTLRTCAMSVDTNRQALLATTVRLLGVHEKEEMGPDATPPEVAAGWILSCRAIGISIDVKTTATKTGTEAKQVRSAIRKLNSNKEILRTISKVEHQVGGSLAHTVLTSEPVEDVPSNFVPLDELNDPT